MLKRLALGLYARSTFAAFGLALAITTGCTPAEVTSAGSSTSGAPTGQVSTGGQQVGATPGGAATPGAGGTTPSGNGAGQPGSTTDDPSAVPGGDATQPGAAGPGAPNAPTPAPTGDANSPNKAITLGLVSPRSSPDPFTAQPTDSAQPVLQGDLSRFGYAFFTTKGYEVNTKDTLPFFGLVVTADGNFCTRSAAPLHTPELTAFRLQSGQEYVVDANTVYTQTTYPSYNVWYPAYSEQQPPAGSDHPGFETTCALFDPTLGSRSFAQASWTLAPEKNKTLQTAATVTVALKASNNAQNISWRLTAQRCDKVANYFQDVGGNHVNPQTIPCVRPNGATTTPPTDAGQGNTPTDTTPTTGTTPSPSPAEPNAP